MFSASSGDTLGPLCNSKPLCCLGPTGGSSGSRVLCVSALLSCRFAVFEFHGRRAYPAPVNIKTRASPHRLGLEHRSTVRVLQNPLPAVYHHSQALVPLGTIRPAQNPQRQYSNPPVEKVFHRSLHPDRIRIRSRRASPLAACRCSSRRAPAAKAQSTYSRAYDRLQADGGRDGTPTGGFKPLSNTQATIISKGLHTFLSPAAAGGPATAILHRRFSPQSAYTAVRRNSAGRGRSGRLWTGERG